MSQVTNTKESGIKARISRLSDLTDSVEDLEKEKSDIEKKRNDQRQKNNAFEELNDVISDSQSYYNNLCRAVELADVLGVSVPNQDIEQTLDKYRPKLRELDSKSFDDFTDVNEINSTRKEFEDFKEALSDHSATVKSSLTSAADDELSDVNTRETILLIPDVGTPEDANAVSTYQSKIESIKRGQIIDAEELREAKLKYSKVDIDIETIRSNYELSKDAGELLLLFLRNETVTLADIDDGVLDELKALEEFSGKLTIQF